MPHDAPPDIRDFLPPEAPPATPRRRRVLRQWLTLPLFALGGGVVGALLARSGLRLADAIPGISVPIALLGLLLGFWPNIVLHEAGHALAGLSRGMRAIAFGLGPLRWERGQSGWRVRRGSGLGGASGFAALAPHAGRGLGRVDQAVYLAGGPMANLLTAAAAFALLPWLAGAPWLASALLGLGAGALLVGLLNLVPFHAQGWRSDGRGLLDLLLRSPDAALVQRIQHVMSLSLAGVRPRDWPAALVPGEPGTGSPILAANGWLLRLAWAMDRGDVAAAGEAAMRATALWHALPAGFRPHVAASLAGHAARMLRDPGVLSAWRPLCEGGITDLSPIRAWLDAEAAVLDGARDAARAIAAARALLHRAPDPATVQLLGEYLDELERRSPAGPGGDPAAVKLA